MRHAAARPIPFEPGRPEDARVARPRNAREGVGESQKEIWIMKKVIIFLMFLVIGMAANAASPINTVTGRYRVAAKVVPAMKDLNDGHEIARAGEAIKTGNMQPVLTLIGEGRMAFLKQGEIVQGVMQVKEMMLIKNAEGRTWWVMASHVTRLR
jgi:hypothetical protein